MIPNIQNKQATTSFQHNHLNFSFDFVNIHQYTKEELISSNSTIAYIMAIDKCKSREELVSLLDTLSTLITNNTSKKFIQRLIFFIFDCLFDKEVKSELIKKFKERDDLTMKTNWEYIIEDIQKSVTKNRNAAIREGKREGRKEGKKEGLLEGEKIGKLNGFLEIAQNMIRGGETSDKITLYTGFSKSKIEKMKREMNV